MADADKYVIDFTDPLKASFSIKSYTSNGPIFPTFKDGGHVNPIPAATSVAVNTSLLLYGRALPDYGERINENFVHLLENFSGPGTPVAPISGQLWHRVRNYWKDTTAPGTPIWSQWDGTTWIALTITAGGTVPANETDGTYVTTDSLGNPAGITGTLLYIYMVANDAGSWVLLEYTESAADPLDGSPDAEPDAELMLWDGDEWTEVTPTGFSIASGAVPPVGPSVADLWYDTNPADDLGWSLNQLKIYNGAAFVSVAENYLQREGDTLLGVLEVGSPALMNIGDITPTNRTDVVPYGVILDLSSDDISSDADIPGATVTDILNDKIDNIAAGDQVLGDLTLIGTGGITPPATDVNVLLRNGSDTGPRDFSNEISSVAVNKFYVDTEITSATSGVDKYVSVVTFYNESTGSPNIPNTLVLEYSNGDTPIAASGMASVSHVHTASEITNTPSGSIVATDVQGAIDELDANKAPITTPEFIGNVGVASGVITLGVEPTEPAHATTKRYVDDVAGTVRRAIFDAAGSPAVGPYDTPVYVVGRNQTFVTVAGIKQYSTTRGYQEVDLLSTSGDPKLSHSILTTDTVLDEVIITDDFTSLYIAGVGFEIIGSLLGNDGTYTVQSNSTLTSEATDVFTVADVAGSLDGTYFLLSGISVDYYVWMDVDAGGNDPDPDPGFRFPVQVSLTSGDDAATVATQIATAVSGAGSPDEFTAVTFGSPSDGVRITVIDPGVAAASSDFDTGFTITRETVGGNTIIPTVEALVADETGEGTAAPSYGATITVDGTPFDIVIIGYNATSYQDLTDQIIEQLSLAGSNAFATLNIKDNAIRITSQTYPIGSPAGSTVNIVDAVFVGSPASELPLFSSIVDFVAIDAAVGAKNYDYQEVGFDGDDSTQILFEADPGVGIIEVLVY